MSGDTYAMAVRRQLPGVGFLLSLTAWILGIKLKRSVLATNTFTH